MNVWPWLVWPWLVGFLVTAWLLQFVPAATYSRRMRRERRDSDRGDHWPRLHLFMAVRNGGEAFREALARLPGLDYPNFHLSVVIDDPSDPAVPILDAMRATLSNVSWDVQFLRDHQGNSGLICASFVQMFEHLDARCELITFCGADMYLPRTYLRDMAAAMRDPRVGATLGNRWYRPRHGGWGSLVRYLWNAGAVVPMWFFEVPWGGAVALRPDDVRRSGLLDDWRKSMVEDAPIKSALRRIGLRLEFVPHLIVVEDAEIGLRDAVHFIARQLLWTRLYHPGWGHVVLNAVFFTTAMFLPWLLAIINGFTGETNMAIRFAAAGVGYWLGAGFLLVLLERAVMHAVNENGQQFPGISVWRAVKILFAIPFTQLLYCAALVWACFAQEVTWSGVRYRLHGGRRIEITHYSPIVAGGPETTERTQSVVNSSSSNLTTLS